MNNLHRYSLTILTYVFVDAKMVNHIRGYLMIRFYQQKQLEHKLVQGATQIEHNLRGGRIKRHVRNAGAARQLQARGSHIGLIEERQLARRLHCIQTLQREINN